MGKIKIFTLGVYGSTKESFFKQLTVNGIELFCDIRRRRAVRGSEYTYVNSKRLQDHLRELKINYMHIPELAPPDELRKYQYEIDKELKTTQRQRQKLSETFIKKYKQEVLKNYNFNVLIEQIENKGIQRIVLFCVEKFPSACHRSIVAEHLHNKSGFMITHL